MRKKLKYPVLIVLALLSLIMHSGHFKKDLMGAHVWRQSQTQSNIINFYEEDFNILNPRRNARGNTDGIYRMEFPLMQWIVAGFYKIFGNHIAITRISMFILGLIAVYGMYSLLFNIFQNQILSLMGAWAFNFSPGFFYYTINPLPDNMALCCSLWGLSFFFFYLRRIALYKIILSALLLSIGVLCKLPFVIYFSVPFTYFLIRFARSGIKRKTLSYFAVFTIIFLLPFIWYIVVIPTWTGNGVVKGIFDNAVSFQLMIDYIKTNVFTFLPEILLNYGSVPFFLLGIYFFFQRKKFKHLYFLPLLALSLSLIFYFIYELNMIAGVHDYYLFPFYSVLFILVSYGAYGLFSCGPKIYKFITLFVLILLPFTSYLRMKGSWNPDKPGFNKDLLVYRESLRSSVPDDALCIAGNDESHAIFLYYIHKKGWGFHGDELTEEKLNKMIQEGAQFLFSDSRTTEEKIDIKPYLKDTIASYGSINVFRISF